MAYKPHTTDSMWLMDDIKAESSVSFILDTQ